MVNNALIVNIDLSKYCIETDLKKMSICPLMLSTLDKNT